jgi:RNA polymerase sigma-70 factor (ECF subfamily)
VNGGWEHDGSRRNEWETWVAEHSPGFLLFARQQSRSEAEAQDLVQEAIVECWNKQADGSPPPKEWVFATIRRRAIDAARTQTRRAQREQTAHDQAPGAWFDSSPEDRERDHLIANAMQQLPDIYREVITLKIWGGLTFEAIAGALDIPANTAASRYRYGLAELRKLTKGVLA